MNLRGRGRLSTSAVCLNHRSSRKSIFSPCPISGGMTEANILDRAAVRMSAMSLFTSDPKQRSHSFPRRGFFSGPTKNVATATQNGNGIHNDVSKATTASQTPLANGLQKLAKKFAKPSAKPPLILVYTGDRKELYSAIAKSLEEILPRDTYTVRDLTIRALKFQPWSHEHCACLIVASTDQLDDRAWAQLQHYFNSSGKMLFVCQNALLADLTSCGSTKKQINLLKSVFERKTSGGFFGKEFEAFLKKTLKQLSKTQEVNEVFHANDPIGGYQFAVVLCKRSGQPFLLYMQTSENHKVRSCALFSDATTDELLGNGELVADALSRLGVDIRPPSTSATDGGETDAPRLSVGYLFCQKDRLVLDIAGLTYGKMFDAKLPLIFQHLSRRDEEKLLAPSPSCLPILVCRRSDAPAELADCFNYSAYFDVLKTKRLGRVLLYVPVSTTTIDIAKSLSTAFPGSDGILISTGYQIHGRGRSGNVWLSPRGCAMLQFNFIIPMDSELGRSITFVQHIVAVAMVDAILTRADDKNFPIKIKWPNDIYYKRDFKLGGILMIASQSGTHFECSIGAGVNISNVKPTVCVNNFLTGGKSLVVEEYLAETMNKFEHYVNVFVNQGKAEFIKKYMEYWMHTGDEVTIVHEDNKKRERVIVRGLDGDGFLCVQSKETGRIFSVHDDGNSFDVMRGLIHPKE